MKTKLIQLLYGLFFLLIIYPLDSLAIIPGVISSNMTISSNDFSVGNVTVSAGCTLTINNAAIATISGDLVVNGYVDMDGSTLKMGAGKRILISNGVFKTDNGVLITSLSTVNPWKGFEVPSGQLSLLYTTVSFAENAVTNYIPNTTTVGPSSGGTIWCTFTTFTDILQHSARISNQSSTPPGSNPYVSAGSNWGVGFQHCTFNYTSSFNPPVPPIAMVTLSNCKNIIFLSCYFDGPGGNCVGIRAVNSSMRVQPYFYGTRPRGWFKNLARGIVINNSLQPSLTPIILETDFFCKDDIHMSGVMNPLILDNTMLVSYNPPNDIEQAIFLNNCTGYKVEGNIMKGHPMGGVGIVVKNSGSAYNEINRNISPGYPLGLLLGVQSIGQNANLSRNSGLKILCNDLLDYGSASSHAISVMLATSGSLPVQGVANKQFPPQLFGNGFSAGNLFPNTIANYNPGHHYYLQSGTYSPQFEYKADPIIPEQTPTYRDPNFLVNSGNSNSCPRRVSRDLFPYPLLPFTAYTSRLSGIEASINTVYNKTSGHTYADTMELDWLLTEHALLVDSLVTYYQLNDNLDSIILAYEQVTVGYHYKLYLAAAYAEQGRYAEALTVLSRIPSTFALTTEEDDQLVRLQDIYEVKEWLFDNDNDWSNMPDNLKEHVYACEGEDAMFAGAIARSLLVEHEEASYPSEYILSDPGGIVNKPFAWMPQTKIYPNPTHDMIYIWADEANSELIVTDVLGKTVVQQALNQGLQQIDLQHLGVGVYFASMRSANGSLLHQEKILKQ